MAVIEVLLDSNVRRFRLEKLIMAGYTGRDQKEVQAHIDELRKQGIPAPSHIPTLFACSPELLTTANHITVLGTRTAGEGEAVLLVNEGEVLIGVGSDHTDRELEITDIPRAKQICAKVIANTVWRFTDVMEYWDELILRSWVREGNTDLRYQEGPLARLMHPNDVLAYIQEHTLAPFAPAVVFTGTFPLLTDGFRPGATFTVELEDARRERRLRCQYEVSVLDYLR